MTGVSLPFKRKQIIFIHNYSLFQYSRLYLHGRYGGFTINYKMSKSSVDFLGLQLQFVCFDIFYNHYDNGVLRMSKTRVIVRRVLDNIMRPDPGKTF